MGRKRAAKEMEEDVSITETVENICKTGDVIFELTKNKPTTRLRVSSGSLSMASEPFATLLGPRFLEGQNERSSSNPVTIALPDDDPQAMADLCRLLHFVPVPELAKGEDLDRIVALGVVADKWCCTDALALPAQGILLNALYRRVDDDDGLELTKLAAASYFFNDNETFTDVVDRLLLSYSGPFSLIQKELGNDLLPQQFYLIVAEQRSLVRESLSVGLRDMGAVCQNCKECHDDTASRTDYKRHIAMSQPRGAWPPRWQSDCVTIADAVKHIRSLSAFVTGPAEERCQNRSCRGWIKRHVQQDQFEKLAAQAELLTYGLSIRCVRNNCTVFKGNSLRCGLEADSKEEDEETEE